MSKAYREETGDIGVSKTTPEMRIFCSRPGKMDAEGNYITFTEQAHKKECDVNHIIKKYDVNGVISHVNKIEGKFGDVSGQDFKSMSDTVANARTMFEKLPSDLRNEFKNDPGLLLQFMDDPDNRDKAIKLGLIRGDWSEDSDGLGEHIKSDKDRKKKENINPPEETT